MANRELLLREFGLALNGERRRKRLSQAQFAAKVGLSRTSVTNIERGRQSVQLHQLYQFAAALQIEVAKLLPKVTTAVEAQAPSDSSREYLAGAVKLVEGTGRRPVKQSNGE